ncbi:MAG: EAL domain-containing protein [Acidimicrobiales bacterium]|nr:EAL domain-containing protein [Acidimicrobiales bacterium]
MSSEARIDTPDDGIIDALSRRSAYRSLSVRSKILAALVLVSVLPLVLLGVLAYERQAAGFENEVLDRLNGTASALEQQLDAEMDRDLQLVSQVVNDRELRRAVEAHAANPDATTAQDVRAAAFRMVNWPIISVSVLDPDSEFIATTDQSPDRLNQSGAAQAVRRGQILGFVAVGPQGSAVSVPHGAIRIDGELLGRVMLEVDLSSLNELTNDYRGLGETGEILIVQREGSVGDAQLIANARLSGAPAFETTIDVRQSEALEVRALNSVEFTLADYVDRRGVATMATTRQLPLSGWGLVVKVDRAEALQVADDFRTTVLAALIMATVAILALSWLVARMITHPIRRLTDAAAAIAAGDVNTRVAVTTSDEIGALAGAFNAMTDELVDLAGHEAERTSQLQISNRRLRENESRIRAILEHAADGIMQIDDQGRILGYNEAVHRTFGRSDATLIGTTITDFVLPVESSDDLELDADDPVAVLRVAVQQGHSGLQAWVIQEDGSRVPVLMTVSRIDDGPVHSYTALVRDISERLEFERKLEHQANHDALTGLPNRDVINAELAKSLEMVRKGARPIGLLFMDIDRFKLINDTLGHQAGDELLCAVTSRLRDAVRPTDIVARFGGDEFVVLARDLTDADDMMIVANRIADSAIRPFHLDGEEVFTSFSIGIVVTADGQSTTDEMIGNADVAMYRAKQSGRNRIEVFDEDMRDRIRARHELGNALRHAVENRDLHCDYQPIFDVASGEIVAVEALARWHRPDIGFVSPGEFIPVAEETDLIIGLGRNVLHMACTQLAQWTAAHPDKSIRMAVNLSGRELADPDCVESVRSVLKRTAADPALLTLEITESVLLEDLERAARTLQDLRDLGIRIAIDDFGTGYSSLTYLRRFPIDLIKIDRTFMGELEDTEIETPIVSMVLALARDLGVDVVAEGVENLQQLNRLRDLGCQLAQGFYYARPGVPEAVAELVWPTAPQDGSSVSLPLAVSAGRSESAPQADQDPT